MNLFTYWNSDKMVLSMHGAQEVDRARARAVTAWSMSSPPRRAADAARLHHGQPAAQRLRHRPQSAERRGRRDHRPDAALNREEVAGVIAHELAHIKNRDTLIMTITATIAGAISMLAQFGLFFGGGRNNNNPLGIIGTLAMVILAPIAAMLVQMAISRTREYAADRLGAEIAAARSGWPPRSPRSRRGARDPQRRRRAQSGDRAYVHRQPAVRRAHGQPVLDPSGDREPHRRAAAARLRNEPGRLPRAGARLPRPLGRRPPRIGALGLIATATCCEPAPRPL
jgi:hypothetical protein